jgi:hypothetical protein
MASAIVAYGTASFSPSRRHRPPSRVAVVVGISGSAWAGSWSPAVSTDRPSTTGGSNRVRWSAVPNSAIGSAAVPIVASNGSGAT